MTSERTGFDPPRTTLDLGVVIGVWLLVSPFVLGFSGYGVPTWNDAIAGVGILAVVHSSYRHEQWHGYAAVLLGVWVLISPWVLGYAQIAPALWNSVVAGIILAGAAVTRLAPAAHR